MASVDVETTLAFVGVGADNLVREMFGVSADGVRLVVGRVL
jgi:hypothetical protein